MGVWQRLGAQRFALLAAVLIATTGGAVGACAFLASQGHRAENIGALTGLIGTMVAVIGWFASSRINAESQREHLHLVVLNEARKVIVADLRAERDRLGECGNELMATAAVLRATTSPAPILLAHRMTLMTLVRREQATSWLFALEEHAALFPEFGFCRLQLASRAQKISTDLVTFAVAVGEAASRGGVNLGRDEAARLSLGLVADELQEHVREQASLMTDAQRHVQERALGEISGNSVPRRTPPDDRVLRLTTADDGTVRITVPDGDRRAMLEAAGWLTYTFPSGHAPI